MWVKSYNNKNNNNNKLHQLFQVLRTFASNALVQAHKQNMKSIAIPAIGSGTLKVPHDIVVNVLMNEIFKFSKTNPGNFMQ